MASDLKIEIFACKLFYSSWIEKDIKISEPKIFQMFEEECCKVETIYEACDDLFALPIACRQFLFKNVYMDDFTDEKATSLTSLMDCYNYIESTCNRIDLFGGLTVFDRMFATFTFVLKFCVHMKNRGRLEVVDYGHIFWAMYFDKFTEEFYLRGGWPRLKEVAIFYAQVYSLIEFLKEKTNFKLKEALENYFDFINSDPYKEHKRNQKKVTVTKLWINFRKQRFENYITIPITDQYFFTALEIEDLLTRLKKLSVVWEENVPSTDRKCSEIPTDHVEKQINTNDSIEFQQLPERKFETSNTSHMHEKIPDKNLTSCNVTDAMLFRSEDAWRNENLTLEESLETSYSKKDTDLRETHTRTETISTNNASEAQYNEKISTCIFPTSQFIDACIDELYSKNPKIEETSSAPEILLTNQIHKSSHDRKLSPCTVTEEMNQCSQSDNGEDVNKTFEEADYSENRDDKTEVAEKKAMQFTNKMDKSKSIENLHILPTSQSIDACIDELYSKYSEIEETPSAPEILSTNQMHKSFIEKHPLSRVSEMTTLCSANVVVGDSEGEANKKILEMTAFSKNGNDQPDGPERKAMQFTNQMEKSESDENSLNLPSRQFMDEAVIELYSRKTTEEISHTPQDLSTSQVHKFFHDRNLCPCGITGEKNLCPLGDSDVSNSPEVLPTNQISESNRDENTTLDTLHVSKVCSPVNRCENTGDEIKKNDGIQEDLRNEQEDSSVKIFLGMFLVLNDRQGTNVVYQALQNIEDPQKTEVIPNKSKKKSKNKNK